MSYLRKLFKRALRRLERRLVAWRVTRCPSCCCGIRWGGEAPIECRDCDGSGNLWILPTGQCFTWPGGPARGSWPGEYKRARKP